MLEAAVEVRNQLGLHARAAAQLVRLANEFKSTIIVSREDTNSFANAKSILSILTLAASMGTKLLVTAEGDDEEQALASIKSLFLTGFGEV
ncbi:MAG: HPr family phosphocarrier protein [Acidobacteriota bacterium]